MMMRDDDGQEIHAGDVVSFCYGIPPVGVQAKVADINGVLFAMTPGHKPDKCKLSELRRHVGGFHKIRRHTTMPNETVTPADVAELITKLREGPDVREVEDGSGAWELDPDKTGETMQEAATALESLSDELAATERAHDATCRMLAAFVDDLTTERAAHAETRRERDEHKRLKNELVLKAYSAMDGADDLIEALGRYGFPVSDAAEPALMEGGSREAQALHKAAKAFIAARRALEGGE